LYIFVHFTANTNHDPPVRIRHDAGEAIIRVCFPIDIFTAPMYGAAEPAQVGGGLVEG
jgi:hypothetical protein